MPVRHLLVVGLWALGACGGARSGEPPVRVTVLAERGSDLDLDLLEAQPKDAVLSVERLHAGQVDVVARRGGTLSLRHPEGCPLDVPLDKAAPGSRLTVKMRAWFHTSGDQPQLGFDAPYQITVNPGCPGAGKGRIDWAVVGGVPATFEAQRNGFLVKGRTPAAPHAAPPWGVVPFSPITRGEVVFEGTWKGPDHAEVKRRVSVAAAPRSTGIPTVGVGHRVYLGGAGWVIERPPPGGAAKLETRGVYTTLLPDARGRWILKDGRGTEYALQVGRADEMQFDCVRSDCHANIGHEIDHSPMTTVLRRALEGELDAAMDPRCAIACHSAGEPGLPDGGFDHVASELGFGLPSRAKPGLWASLPRDLRRTGGVGCIACHGPAAVPERSARWSVLRADVCAICHDAPPRYRHVEAWRTSRMARADAAPGAREGRCAACHTTWGFLQATGVRAPRDYGVPPAEAGAIGLTCPVCHTNHGQHLDRAVIRKLAPPASLAPVSPQTALQSGSVCLRCHAPDDGPGAPAASAAAMVLARGGVATQTGQPLVGSGLHANVEGGCVGCHLAPGDGGASHGFKTDPKRCTPCHAGGAPPEKPDARGRLVAARARALYARIAPGAPADRPAHAAPVRGLDLSPDGPRGRALKNLLLVLEDPAAGVHNAEYARRLLDEAEAVLGAPP